MLTPQEPGESAQSVALSRDGRSFEYLADASPSFQAGEFIVLEISASAVHRYLAQVTQTASRGSDGLARGQVLAEVSSTGAIQSSAESPFSGARMLAAPTEIIAAFHSRERATLDIGVLRGQNATDGSVARAHLAAHRFNRHTFWCGQSGSGKTYALGVVLEQLLIHTRLPMVILDPNADFVGLGVVSHNAEGADGRAIATADIRVLRNTSDAELPLRVRFTALDARGKAAALQLDPIANRLEFNSLLHADEDLILSDPDEVLTKLVATGDEGFTALAMRIENLGILDWGIWAGEARAVTEVLDDEPRATVLDLSSVATREEMLLVAMATLDHLWENREKRQPRLIVMDEAHNLCAPNPSTPLERAVLDRITQIAAEGRKYGLWLLLSTQRPSKIHPNILSQCDNLALMKLSSPADLDELASVFGYAPTELLRESPYFRQGEALFAGGFAPAPSLVQMGERLTVEGGSDVAVPLR
jgi:uncharacterized protein